jgi:hypothetical protein
MTNTTQTSILSHVSASQIATFLLCPRKWWLDKLGDNPIVRTTASQALGRDVHAVLESYLKSETSTLDHPLLAKDTFPQTVDRSSVLVEHAIKLDRALPVVGLIDLVIIDHANKICEVWDHKTTKDWRYAKTEEQLREDIQAKVYCLAMRELLGPEYIYKFGHHVILTSKASPTRCTQVELTQEMLDDASSWLDSVIAYMLDVAQLNDGLDVPPVFSACWAYGGCPYRERCHSQNPAPMPKRKPVMSETPSYPEIIFVDCYSTTAMTSFANWTVDLVEEFKRDVKLDPIMVKYGEGINAIALAARDKLQAPKYLAMRSFDSIAMKYLSLVEAYVPLVVYGR